MEVDEASTASARERNLVICILNKYNKTNIVAMNTIREAAKKVLLLMTGPIRGGGE